MVDGQAGDHGVVAGARTASPRRAVGGIRVTQRNGILSAIARRTTVLAVATFVSKPTSSPMPAGRHRSGSSVQEVGRYRRRSISVRPRSVA
jgi:hypothetical protein